MRRVIRMPMTSSGLRDLVGEREGPRPLAYANAIALAVVLPPDVLYHETQHNARTLTSRDTRIKAIRQKQVIWHTTNGVPDRAGNHSLAPPSSFARPSPAHRFRRSTQSVQFCRCDASRAAPTAQRSFPTNSALQ
jgi:hypothetical protein